MALSTAVGSFAQPAATGNQAITGLGFQPKVVLFYAQLLTADGNASNAVINFGVGISASLMQCMGITYTQSTNRNNIKSSTTKCLSICNGDNFNTIIAQAVFVSHDADGFTINWDAADATARIISYVALGGTDITNVTCGTDTAAATDTTKAVTGLGFTPSCILSYFPAYATSASLDGFDTFRGGIGWASGSTAQGFTGVRMLDNTNPTEAQSVTLTAHNWAVVQSGSILNSAALSSFDASGFTQTWSNTNGAASFYYWIAIKGAQFKAGSLSQPAATGNQAVTGLGFSPSVTLFQSANKVSSATPNASLRWTLGAAKSSTARFSMWAGVTDGLSASYVGKSWLDRTKAIKLITQASTPTLDAEADFVSNDADGFTVNWSTVDATARVVSYLAIGPAAEAVVPSVSSRRKKPQVHPGAGPQGFGRRHRTKRNIAAQLPTVTGTLAITTENSTVDAAGHAIPIQGSRRAKTPVHPGQGTYNFLRFRKSTRNTSIALGSVNGTLAVTLDDATLAGQGTTTVTGTLAQTLANTTLAAQGTTTIVGTLAVTLADTTLAASGSVGSEVTGTLAVTLANTTVSASGTTTVVGSLAQTTAATTMAGQGTTTVTGSISQTLGNTTLAASGTPTVTGTLAQSFAASTLAASGTAGAPSGTVSVTLDDATLSAQGTPTVIGFLSSTLQNTTLSSVEVAAIVQGGGGGKRKAKSWDQRERERLEAIRLDQEAKNKAKYGDLPPALQEALGREAKPYKRLSPQTVKAYANSRHQDDEEAMNLILAMI
ncbi:MAG: hypothetical protein M3Y08_01305 [Fibrobacterota bacterium]|nr:hypothetical protein [Fibrobacterota bacterium]